MAYEQVVEPVLGAVVVRAPALTKRGVRTAAIALIEKCLAVDLRAGDLHAEVLLLRAGRIPSLVFLLGRGRVELRVGVGAVAEVTGQSLADHASGRGHARRARGADCVGEGRAIDGGGE